MRRNNESGAILPMVIIFMLALTITGLAFLNSTVMEHNLAMREVHKNQAFYLAEGGVEHARVVLREHWEDWGDYSPVTPNTELEGTYSAYISDEDTGGDKLPEHKRRIKSIGTVKNVSQIVQVIVKQAPSGADIGAALEAGGDVEVSGNATIIGDLDNDISAVIAKGTLFKGKGSFVDGKVEDKIPSSFEGNFPRSEEYKDYFEYIFKATREEMKDMARTSPNDYYDHYIQQCKDLHADHITWIEAPGQESQITSDTWSGEGILIVNGSLKMTGGSFDGIVWVTEGLTIPKGEPIIRGAVFTQTDITVPVGGTVDLIYDSEKIGTAVKKIATLPWIEPGSWEQLK